MEKEPLSFGLPNVDPLSMTNMLSQSAIVSQETMVQAELAPPTSVAALGFAQQEAVARGYLRHFVSKLDPSGASTSDVLKIVGGAIRSQDFATLNKVSPDLASVLSIYTNKPDEFSKYNNFAKEILQGQIAIADSTSSLAKAEVAAASARTAAGIISGSSGYAEDIFKTSFTIEGLGSYVSATQPLIEDLRSQALLETDEGIKSAMLSKAEAAENSLISGSVSNALRNLKPDQVDRLRATLASGDTQYIEGLSSSARADFFVIEQSFSSAEQRAKIDNLMAEYASGPAKFIEDTARLNAQAKANQFIDSQLPSLINSGNLDGLSTNVKTLNENLSTISGLSEGDIKTSQERIYVEGARAALGLAIGQLSSEQQVLAISSYIRTGNAEGLPPSFVQSLDKVKEYSSFIDDKGFLDSVINTFSLQRQRELEAKAKEASIARATQLATTGQANPQTEEGRTAASNLVLRDLNSIITRDGSPPVSNLPTDLLTNPAYANDQRFSQIFSRIYNTQNLMPNELQTALQSVADGNLNVTQNFDYKTVLSHYEKMRLIEGPTGSIPNPALDALSLEQRGVLNFLLDAPTVLGSEADIGAMFSSARQLQLKEDYPRAVERFLGDVKLDQWLVNSIDDYSLLNNSEQASIKALTNFMISQSLSTSGMNMSEASISRAVNRQMNEWFPDGGGKVVQIDQFGMASRRTKYALSKTVGAYEDDFVNHILSNVATLTSATSTARSFYNSVNAFSGPRETSQAMMEGLGFIKVQPYLELVAAGPDSLGGVSYYVHEFDPSTGIRKMVRTTDASGAQIPLIFSTKEPEFVSKTNAKELSGNAEQLRRAELDKLIYDDLQNNIPVSP